jgi:hypothetical protein
MKRLMRRLGYAIFISVWLLLILFPVGAFMLATKGQLEIGSESGSHLRLFLLQEKNSQGVVVEWVRSSRVNSDCRQGTVTYLLWEGSGDNVVYCQCTDPVTGSFLPSTIEACSAP